MEETGFEGTVVEIANVSATSVKNAIPDCFDWV